MEGLNGPIFDLAAAGSAGADKAVCRRSSFIVTRLFMTGTQSGGQNKMCTQRLGGRLFAVIGGEERDPDIHLKEIKNVCIHQILLQVFRLATADRRDDGLTELHPRFTVPASLSPSPSAAAGSSNRRKRA